MKITGLEEMSKQLKQVTEAFEENGGKLGDLRFNPGDPASIEAAIQEAERLVDERISAFPNNSLLASLGEQMKERYRSAIVERAATARLENETGEETE